MTPYMLLAALVCICMPMILRLLMLLAFGVMILYVIALRALRALIVFSLDVLR